LHVAINSIPDVTVFLLAIAGLVYLMPKLVKRIETNKVLRRLVAIAVILFCIFAIIVNAINREAQDRKDEEHTKAERDNSGRVYQVQSSLSELQTSLLQSKGTMSEVDRRRHILQTLRDEYVLSHKSAPISMIAGNEYPPAEWMNEKLRQLGEAWQYISPEDKLKPPSTPPAQPPAAELVVATGNDMSENLSYQYKAGYSWIDEAKNCTPPFKCYPDFLLPTHNVELHIGPKGWARMFFVLYNTGGTPLTNANVAVNLSQGHGVSINRMGDHHPLGDSNYIVQEFKAPMNIDKLLPYKNSQSGYNYICDLVVDRTIGHFNLGVRVYGDNMEAKVFVFRVDVISDETE
jgi:preprotein translocase subunit SecG